MHTQLCDYQSPTLSLLSKASIGDSLATGDSAQLGDAHPFSNNVLGNLDLHRMVYIHTSLLNDVPGNLGLLPALSCTHSPV